MSYCNFCAELDDKIPARQVYEAELWGEDERVLWENDNFVVIPTVGCITPGYLLLLPKEHNYSFADVPTSLRGELMAISTFLRKLIAREYKCQVLIAEHGSIQCDRGAACCDHAHLHFIPVPDDEAALEYYEDISEDCVAMSLEDLFILKGTTYILAGSDPIHVNIWRHQDGFTSQFCRKVAAREWNVDDQWDWRRSPNYPNIRKTLDQLRGKFGGLDDLIGQVNKAVSGVGASRD